MQKRTNHVLPNPRGGWSVLKSGASRAARVFETKQAAVTYGRTLARNEHSNLYVHRSDGTISETASYASNAQIAKHAAS